MSNITEGGVDLLALWITLGIVAFFWLLLATPLRIFLSYDQELHFRVKYGPILIADSEKPPKPKKEKEESPSEKKPETKKDTSSVGKLLDFLGLSEISSIANVKNSIEKAGIVGTLQAVSRSIRELFLKIFRLVRKGKFKKFRLQIIAGDEDCGDAAVQYGKICAVAFPLLAFLKNTMRFREQIVDIRCDYSIESTQVSFDGQLNYRPWHFVCFLTGLLIDNIKRSVRKEQ